MCTYTRPHMACAYVTYDMWYCHFILTCALSFAMLPCVRCAFPLCCDALLWIPWLHNCVYAQCALCVYIHAHVFSRRICVRSLWQPPCSLWQPPCSPRHCALHGLWPRMHLDFKRGRLYSQTCHWTNDSLIVPTLHTTTSSAGLWLRRGVHGSGACMAGSQVCIRSCPAHEITTGCLIL